MVSQKWEGGVLNEHILFINCRGGNGGTGGCGGNGGKGGDGGKGGNGRNGANGTGVGGNGQNGGDGGRGGDGGDGGSGGNGGDGGYAGCGGTCIIQATDSRLLMLVETDCRSGIPGKGGNGGRGGVGGAGGIGGSGGKGGRGADGRYSVDSAGREHVIQPGRSGAWGRNGTNGQRGRTGANGTQGRDGDQAKDGNIQWVHYSASDSSIISKSDQRYEAEVVAFKVAPSNSDGIFEPNGEITISEVHIVNSGGMSIPEGATVFFPKARGINFLPTIYKLPGGLAPAKRFIVPALFKGRVVDQPPPNSPGPFSSSVQFCSRIEILGRPFEKSFHFRKLDVQYPVKLAHIRSSESLGRGEISFINIGIQNISTLPYGKCPKSGGTVIVQLHFDCRIIQIASAHIDMKNVPYRVYANPEIPDSTFVEVQEISPKSTINLQVTIQMDTNAELFDRCMWQADLILRGKLIEYGQSQIRVSPIYIPLDPPADILFVTSQTITRKQFVLWQRLFTTIQARVDYWDVDKHNGLSIDSHTQTEHANTWKGRYTGKMILYPYCNLQTLRSVDLVKHFNGNQATETKEVHSSTVLFMKPLPQQNDQNKALLRYLSIAARPIPGIAYGGKHMTRPDLHKNPQIYTKCEKQSIKALEKENPSQLPIVATREINVQSAGTFKYSYGSVSIRRIPLLHSAKFLVVQSPDNAAINFGTDDEHLSTQTSAVPLASAFGQVFISVLFGVSMSVKLDLLKTEQSNMTFVLPNGCKMSIQDLAMITMAWEIADEVYNFSGVTKRMQIFANDMKSNTAAYVANSTTILRGLGIIKNEAKKRKDKLKKLSNSKISQACNEINQLCSEIENVLIRRTGVSKKGLSPIATIDVLSNTSQFFLPHQLVQKDKKWDLID